MRKKVMRPGFLALICGAALLAGLLGCTPSREGGTLTPEGAGIPIKPDTLERICGIIWVLEAMTVGQDPVPLEKEAPRVRFETDGKLGGSATVNRFFGSLRFDDRGRVLLSPLGRTMMAGPEALMRQETLFLKAFQEVREVTKAGRVLRAVSEDGGIVLVFRAEP